MSTFAFCNIIIVPKQLNLGIFVIIGVHNGNYIVGFQLNFHPKKQVKTPKDDIDVTSIQNTLLQKNASQLDFVSQFQSLFDDISKEISKELFNSQYKETPLLKKLKDLQTKASKAKTTEEITAIRKSLDDLVAQTNNTKNIKAAEQLGINSLISKK